MNSFPRNIIRSGRVELALRWFLGGVFITASYYKIISPGDFAKAIYSYNLFPPDSINIIAILFPYFELFSGLFLILGVYPRSAILLVNMMILFFIAILSINLVRGHQFDCGCFSYNGSADPGSNSTLLFRNIVLLLFGIYLLGYKGARRGCIQRFQS